MSQSLKPLMAPFRIGVDIGGTFTDLVMVAAGVVVVLVPTPATLGAARAKLGICLRASSVLAPPLRLCTATHTSMTTRVRLGSGGGS